MNNWWPNALISFCRHWMLLRFPSNFSCNVFTFNRKFWKNVKTKLNKLLVTVDFRPLMIVTSEYRIATLSQMDVTNESSRNQIQSILQRGNDPWIDATWNTGAERITTFGPCRYKNYGLRHSKGKTIPSHSMQSWKVFSSYLFCVW